MSAAVIRDEHGAVLGIDYRRSPLGRFRVPGVVPAHALAPGDSITAAGQTVTVLRVRGSEAADRLHVVTRTSGGAEIVVELVPFEDVTVHAAGAFDR